MTQGDLENAIRACYATWGQTYYDEYYGTAAPYPPVHRALLIHLLTQAKVKNVLDAGCGPASFLRDLPKQITPYGFDLTPEMVTEAQRVMKKHRISPNHIWEGSVLSPESFRMPGPKRSPKFDAAICIGVLPHIPANADLTIMANLRNSVKKHGLVILEARNQLFALFTLNRYSYQFFTDELMQTDELQPKAGDEATQLQSALQELSLHFRLDMPPLRKGKVDEPGYDEVLSRTHNPLVLKEQFSAAGFKDVQLLFYHFHSLPPMLSSQVPKLFRQTSVAMEDPNDWRGYFMASAFLLVGRRA